MLAWYRHRGEVADETVVASDAFWQKLRTRVIAVVLDLQRKFNPERLILCFDGHCEWRKTLWPAYKAHRKHSTTFLEIFQRCVILLQSLCAHVVTADRNADADDVAGKDEDAVSDTSRKAGDPPPDNSCTSRVAIYHPKLEADDLVYHLVDKLVHTYAPAVTITVIANDFDYLPMLAWPNVTIKTLANKVLRVPDGLTPEQYRQVKILSGDPSDGIPPCFPRCGKKTAYRLVHDPSALAKKLASNTAWRAQYELNQTLIDARRIPSEYHRWLKHTWKHVTRTLLSDTPPSNITSAVSDAITAPTCCDTAHA